MPAELAPIFLGALRRAESGSVEGNYRQVTGMIRRSDGSMARKVGAYGVASDDWEHLAATAGVPGARWYDPSAQDYVIGHTVDRLYGKYGVWPLVATAWKGGEVVADAIGENPDLVDAASLESLVSYADEVMSYASEGSNIDPEGDTGTTGFGLLSERSWVAAMMATGHYRQLNPMPGAEPRPPVVPEQGAETPMPPTEEDQVLTRRLYAMRDRVRNQGTGGPETEGGEGLGTPAEKPTLVQRITNRGARAE